MTSYFILEVAKSPKSSPKPQNGDLDNQGSVRAYCFAPLAMQLVEIEFAEHIAQKALTVLVRWQERHLVIKMCHLSPKVLFCS